MKFLSFICLLGVTRCVLGKWIPYGDDVSYNDIIKINATCHPRDSCTEDRRDDSPSISNEYSCSCDSQCWQFGTCCVDSPYRNKAQPLQECRNTGDPSSGHGYYMVYRCPDNTDMNSIWKMQCEKEWNDEDDILMLSPVTSLETSTTYKNYYCFKCYESTDKFVSWNLFLQGTFEDSKERPEYSESDFSVTYNEVNKTWVASMAENPVSIPVDLNFLIPYKIEPLTILCETDVISDCPDTWTDKYVHDKCRSYTAIVYPRNKKFLSYKNAHCALCNNESLETISCRRVIFTGGGSKSKFSFTHLIDINRNDGDKVGKIEKCEENHLWDPYGNKCRKLSCALHGYSIKNGICTPP